MYKQIHILLWCTHTREVVVKGRTYNNLLFSIVPCRLSVGMEIVLRTPWTCTSYHHFWEECYILCRLAELLLRDTWWMFAPQFLTKGGVELMHIKKIQWLLTRRHLSNRSHGQFSGSKPWWGWGGRYFSGTGCSWGITNFLCWSRM